MARPCTRISASSLADGGGFERRLAPSTREIDDSSYWDAVCKLRLPAFSWLTHADRDSPANLEYNENSFCRKDGLLQIIDFRLATETGEQVGPDEEKNRARRWILRSLPALVWPDTGLYHCSTEIPPNASSSTRSCLLLYSYTYSHRTELNRQLLHRFAHRLDSGLKNLIREILINSSIQVCDMERVEREIRPRRCSL